MLPGWIGALMIGQAVVCVWSLRVVDLTHPLNSNTHAWPTSRSFEQIVKANGTTKNGGWYSANDVAFAEHTGTHVDAPIHFANKLGIQTASTIPVNRLVAPLVLVDMSGKARDDRDYQVLASDITDWESNYGKIPAKSVVIFSFGWSAYWGSYEKVFGTTSRDTTMLHFPGIGLDAAKILVSRGVYGVGVDTPSLDYGASQDFPVHSLLYDRNIYGIENVADTSQLPEAGKGVTLVVGVMKIDKGSGGPARLLALIDDDGCLCDKDTQSHNPYDL